MLKKFLLITLILLATTSFASAVTQQIDLFRWRDKAFRTLTVVMSSFFTDSYGFEFWEDIQKDRNAAGWRLVQLTEIHDPEGGRDDYLLVFIWEK